MGERIIQRGAEAVLIKKDSFLIKRRLKKSYRFLELDEKIRKQRTKREFNLLEKASKIIPIPKIFTMDEKAKEITMEFIDGQKLSESLDFMKEKLEISKRIGINLAKLHDHDIIHGDLTTSNMVLKGSKLYFIDFGLGFTSKRAEDKAVDLHLIREALEAKHFNIAKQCFEKILEGYEMSKCCKEVVQRLKKVESRGRYKEQY